MWTRWVFVPLGGVLAEWEEVTRTPMNETLTSSLQSLAQCQLQIQVSRAAGLDASAVGTMGVDAAIAASLIGAGSPTLPTLAALVLLCVSFAVVSIVLLMEEADDVGPRVGAVIARREDRLDEELVQDVLHDLAHRVTANQRALECKEPQLAAALLLTLLSVFLALVGQID